jgi:hypothetical protein
MGVLCLALIHNLTLCVSLPPSLPPSLPHRHPQPLAKPSLQSVFSVSNVSGHQSFASLSAGLKVM